MKVILVETIKGKGEKYEVKDFANGYANFLIKEKKAIIANEVNLKSLEELKEKLKVEFMLKANAIEALIKEAESLKIVYERALTPKGTLAKAITKKEILETVNAKLTNGQLSIKDLTTENIKHTGSFFVPISISLGNGARATGNLIVKVIGID